MSAVAAAPPQADVTSPEVYAARLYERHRRAIFGLCMKQRRSREDADDAVQTTFIYALLSLRRGVVPEMELPWLLTIARNACSTRRRSGSRRGAYESPHDLDSLQDRLATPERSDVATSEDFLLALRAIPESQRQALLLREWRGLSYDEIGAELGLSQAATEALLFRARQNVAQRLSASLKTLQGVPLISFLRNLLQASVAKTVAVGAGAALTIAVIPTADSPRRGVPAPSPVVMHVQTGANTPDVSPSRPLRAVQTPTPRRNASRAVKPVTSHTSGMGPVSPAPSPPSATTPTPAASPPPPATPTAPASNGATIPTPVETVAAVVDATSDVGETVDDAIPSLPPVTTPTLPLPLPSLELPSTVLP